MTKQADVNESAVGVPVAPSASAKLSADAYSDPAKFLSVIKSDFNNISSDRTNITLKDLQKWTDRALLTGYLSETSTARTETASLSCFQLMICQLDCLKAKPISV